ncbi:hypothetical protein LguiB_032171 [Lonicera macranthoides]
MQHSLQACCSGGHHIGTQASSSNKKRGFVTGKKTAAIVRTSGKSRVTYDLAIFGPPKEESYDIDPADKALVMWIQKKVVNRFKDWKYKIHKNWQMQGDAPIPVEFIHLSDQWEWLYNHLKAEDFQELGIRFTRSDVPPIMSSCHNTELSIDLSEVNNTEGNHDEAFRAADLPPGPIVPQTESGTLTLEHLYHIIQDLTQFMAIMKNNQAATQARLDTLIATRTRAEPNQTNPIQIHTQLKITKLEAQ